MYLQRVILALCLTSGVFTISFSYFGFSFSCSLVNLLVVDRVFRPDSSTRQVYEEGAKEVALSVVNGINSSIFAYGQTSSGKTYTMSGITEYTVADIYDYVKKHKEREFILKFSAMEIYNESVRDLLSLDTTPLRLLDDPERGTVVERLIEETLRDWNHFKELLSICEAQRQIGETSMNETSSRSHQILRLMIESSAREYLGNGKSSALAAGVNFVDLAGSERASQSLSGGMRLKEGCHINRSLLTLGTVIRKLSKGRNGHVPFRDSKLTRILQSSLGGNARTAIVCTISPARTHVEQSRNTLLFASCAKEVTTNARVNLVVSDKALVKQLQKELARLECQLRCTGSNSLTSDSTELLREKDLQIEKLMSEVAKLNQQLELANSQVENLLRAAEDDGSSTISAYQDHHYPRLRVRNSFKSENSISYSPASEDPHFLDIGVRSFNASQCSAGDYSTNSEENFIQLVEFEDSCVRTNSFPKLSTCTSNFVGDVIHVKDSEELSCENPSNPCKEVQCITVEESSEDKYANSRLSENSPHRYVESNASSPNTNTYTSELTEVEKEDKENQELGSPQLKEEKELNCLHFNEINTSSPNMDRCALELTEVEKENKENQVLGSPQLKEEKELNCLHFDESNASSPNVNTCTSGLTEVEREDKEDQALGSPHLKEEKELNCLHFDESNASPPNISTCTSELTEDEKEDKENQELGSPQRKEEKELNCLHFDFIIPSPERPSPRSLDEEACRSRSLKMIRSRSCRARLTSMPTYLFEKVEKKENTPFIGFEKDFTRRNDGSHRKFSAQKNSYDVELSRNDSSTSVGSATVDDYQLHSIETSIDWKSTSISKSDAGTKYLIDQSEQETKSEAIDSIKSVKSVGLDPIQDDLESAVKWASEFKRLQQEIIELWHACCVSLVHRTYFFLLFKGDPKDSFYMEVELRKLSFLKETFSRGHETLVDGRSLSLASSKRALNQERQMLCSQMQKRLSKEERENIFLKWGISLSSSNRRMQVVHRLWTETTDMDHITQSATLVAKLVGIEGQEQTLKEMFGLLNFTPQHLSRRKFSIWMRSVLSIL
ncbi:hypothetical protein MANES_02G101900v8 [Manihot esculenta]|uniref:Uncharacterized protein n=3 Tax=Manihot esculenta TaxID=3983 RepID=A0ACB7I7H1_MANES|nr:hypothetical protein MANES_02G101900v8 [Manihot esculenta]KAG8660008.1 hypothetical protein MANES_02G101900v8 [Manihot esculenta]KAG8660009.1 hypothetical protein MANES_02G101900v8 [Manihot esculenta]